MSQPELWRESLLNAAATSTFFEGDVEDRSQQGGAFGVQMQSDPMGQALERMLSGDREAAAEDDTAESRRQRGLDGVVLDIEDGIVARAEKSETRYRLIGAAAAPAATSTRTEAQRYFFIRNGPEGCASVSASYLSGGSAETQASGRLPLLGGRRLESGWEMSYTNGA